MTSRSCDVLRRSPLPPPRAAHTPALSALPAAAAARTAAAMELSVGRQEWSASGRLLGAGTSGAATHSEVGLSAQSAAMRHGLKQEAPPGQAGGGSGGAATARDGDAAPPSPRAANGEQQQPGKQQPGEQQPAVGQPSIVSPPAVQVRRRRRAPTRSAPACAPPPRRRTMRARRARCPRRRRGGAWGCGTSGRCCSARRPTRCRSGRPGASGRVSRGGAPARAAAAAARPARHLAHTRCAQPPLAHAADWSRLNNINSAMCGLWEPLSSAIEQQLVAEMAPPLLADAARTYGAGVLTGLRLAHFELGDVRRGGARCPRLRSRLLAGRLALRGRPPSGLTRAPRPPPPTAAPGAAARGRRQGLHRGRRRAVSAAAPGAAPPPGRQASGRGLTHHNPATTLR